MGPKFIAISLVVNAAFVILYVYNKSETSQVETQIMEHLQMLLICTVNSLGFGSFIWWKVYTLLTLRLGMKNQLGNLKYRHNEDG